jgi:hypothetical protein
MVHALEEVWRVLAPGGWMVDLRPMAGNWPMEVLDAAGAGAPLFAGTVDGSPSLRDEVPANAATARMVERGLFAREVRALFEIAYYWPTLSEMETFAASTWANSAVIPSATTREARRLVRSASGRTEIRVRRTMELVRYRRLEPA